jgi:6-pyruvoyltetrahydropterin/6-carboxytetrahydropterin synthase
MGLTFQRSNVLTFQRRKKEIIMYMLAVQRDFDPQHYLVGGDWGAENFPHSHHYRLELRLEGDHLDQHGYLVDIVEVERQLDSLVAAHRDKMLNDLPEFAGLNPSIEHFTRILCRTLVERLNAPTLTAVAVRLWENEIAWAEYRQRIRAVRPVEASMM